MFFKKKKRKIITIEGMHCENCAKKIEKALEELSDIENAKINLKKKIAIINEENDIDELLLQKTIEELGYKVTGIKST